MAGLPSHLAITGAFLWNYLGKKVNLCWLIRLMPAAPSPESRLTFQTRPNGFSEATLINRVASLVSRKWKKYYLSGIYSGWNRSFGERWELHFGGASIYLSIRQEDHCVRLREANTEWMCRRQVSKISTNSTNNQKGFSRSMVFALRC